MNEHTEEGENLDIPEFLKRVNGAEVVNTDHTGKPSKNGETEEPAAEGPLDDLVGKQYRKIT